MNLVATRTHSGRVLKPAPDSFPPLTQFTVYLRPTDFSEFRYVVRPWFIRTGFTVIHSGVVQNYVEPYPYACLCQDYAEVEGSVPYGLVRMAPHPQDDPKIMETWI